MAKKRTGASTSASPPQSKNSEPQPYTGISLAVINPPTGAPIEKLAEFTVTAVARLAGGLNSAVSPMVFGIAPPRPRPVRNRNTPSFGNVVAAAVTTVSNPKLSTDQKITRLRP